MDTSIIITGVYTLIYLVVFLIQRSQLKKVDAEIKAIRETNEAMKTYINVFDPDDVKKYVELKTEIANMEAANFVADSDKMTKLAEEGIKEIAPKIAEVHYKQLVDEQMELVGFVKKVIGDQKEDFREELITRGLPKTSRYLLKMFGYGDKDDNVS